MPTFDLAEVRGFAADLNTRMNRCDNGEGMECANLDQSMLHYASLCCELREGVRQWGRAVFAGRVGFDPEVERVWLEECSRLYYRAMEKYAEGEKAETECYILDGRAALGDTLWKMYQLLSEWVTPARALGPSARQGHTLGAEAVAQAKRKSELLPKLPANWQPANPSQQNRLKMMRRRDS